MRIRRIFVEGLFDTFDYDIPLNADDRITVIHAPNGFGKTTILRMIDALFNARYQVLRKVPFRRFGVELENGRTLGVDDVPETDRKRKSKKARGVREKPQGFEGALGRSGVLHTRTPW